MQTIKLLSFQSETEIAEKARTLRRRGLVVDAAPLLRTSAAISEIASLNPVVVVLDLDRLPSHARVIAESLRNSKSARHIPLLFAGGEAAKLDRVRMENPHAAYTSWAQAPEALARLLDPVPQPQAVAPRMLPNYAATPLPRKLGVIASSSAPRQVALLAAPDGFVETLGDLPVSVTFSQRVTANTALALCFVRTSAELEAAVELLSTRLPQGASAWIVHPKQQHKPGFNQNHVRDAALARGLVDYKVCSVDADWSGLKFAHRKR
jgi:hypothetical protein